MNYFNYYAILSFNLDMWHHFTLHVISHYLHLSSHACLCRLDLINNLESWITLISCVVSKQQKLSSWLLTLPSLSHPPLTFSSNIKYVQRKTWSRRRLREFLKTERSVLHFSPPITFALSSAQSERLEEKFRYFSKTYTTHRARWHRKKSKDICMW